MAARARLTYFVSTESQPRARRPADAFTVFAGLVLLLLGIFGIDRHPPWETALTDFLKSLPSWVESMFALGYAFGLLYGLGILIAVITGGRERRGALRDVSIAAVVAPILGAALGFALTGFWPYVLPEIGLDSPDPRFPVLRVVIITAILVTASPHLSRPLRRLGWLTILTIGASAIALEFGMFSDAVGSLGMGLVVAGTVLLIFGSPRGYPDPTSVAIAMKALGLPVFNVEIDPEQSWGVRRLKASTENGTPITIKAYGRDATESQFAAKVWRTLWYRENGQMIGYSRIQAAEHEALVTLLAQRAGARVPEMLAVGEGSSEIALLAVTAGGTPLPELDPADISDDTLIGIWEDLTRLHSSSIAHGSLNASAIQVGADGHMIADFALGSLSAGEVERAHDVVELLFSLSLAVGAERAVETASNGLGTDTLSSVLPYLQLPAISPSTKDQAEKPKDVMKQLQAAMVAVTGQDLPELAKLRRVSGRNILMTSLLLLVAWALIPLLTSVDYAAVWAVLETANWALIVIALIVGQSMFYPQATATMFAVPRPLPFWPLVVLNLAAKFVSLAIPGAAGRVAMNTAFLRKFGVSITVAVTQGAVDTFSGFLVQCVILIIGFVSSDVNLDIDTVDVNWALILLVVVLVAVGVVVAVLRIRKLRDRILPVVQQGWGTLVSVLRQPSRAFGLLGSNLVYWLILGTTLWLVLEAIDVQISFGAALVVAVATDLLGGFVPIPGGVGVAEAVMTGFLTALGVDQSAAFAGTITYRFITFYLPAFEGFFAMHWLERNEYI
ncbi:MAG TPA: flippase-like domain-containing protein [Acidimicrobiia bacterium]